MTDEDLIAQVQEIAPGSRAENFGPFWRVVLPCGTHAGTRADPVSLARDLMAMEKRVHHAKPDDIDKSKLEAAVERLRAAAEKINAAQPAEREVLQPPEEIADLIRVHETYEQTNTRLLPLYTEAQHMKERAIEDDDKTARITWELKIRKLDLAMHWMHGRLIETI